MKRQCTSQTVYISVAGSGQVRSFALKDHDWWPDHDLTGHKNDNLTGCSVTVWLDLTPVQLSVTTSHWLACSYNQSSASHWLKISHDWSWTGQIVWNQSNISIQCVPMGQMSSTHHNLFDSCQNYPLIIWIYITKIWICWLLCWVLDNVGLPPANLTSHWLVLTSYFLQSMTGRDQSLTVSRYWLRIMTGTWLMTWLIIFQSGSVIFLLSPVIFQVTTSHMTPPWASPCSFPWCIYANTYDL